jgi:hypothetical protein
MIRIENVRDGESGTGHNAEPYRALRILLESDIANGGKVTNTKTHGDTVEIRTQTVVGKSTFTTTFSGTRKKMQSLLYISALFLIATSGINGQMIQLVTDFNFRLLPDTDTKEVMAPFIIAHIRGQNTLNMMRMIAAGITDIYEIVAGLQVKSGELFAAIRIRARDGTPLTQTLAA